jgi:phage host-nuclease inhibitor protein Gam
MEMVAKKKAKEPEIEVTLPADDAQASALLEEYGQVFGEVTAIQVALDANLAKVKKAHEDKAQPKVKRLQEIFATLSAYAAMERKRLTNDGATKTVKLAAGKIGWRKNPPSVKIKSKKKVEDVIAEIRALKMPRFLRRVWELNKQAVLADPEGAAKITSLRIDKGQEEFFVAPIGAELAESK